MGNTPDNDDDNSLALPGQLDLTAAEPLHRTLLDRVRTGDPLAIDGSVVERVSTAAIQVLLATAAEARLRGTPFQLLNPSSELTDALVDLGVASQLGF